MNLRHAAAIALTGWYLMLPPSAERTRWFCADNLVGETYRNFISKEASQTCRMLMGHADADAPLSQWHQYGEGFDSINACVAVKEQIYKEASQNVANEGRDRLPLSHEDRKVNYEMWSNAQCVSTDDPRLKP
jgi:hypothetical protein